LKIYYQKTKAFFTIIIGAQKLKIKPNKLYYNIIKMTTFGDDIYAKNITCEKINGAAPGGGGGETGTNLALSGTLGVTGATTLSSVTASGTLGVTGATTLSSVTASTTLGVTGATTLAGLTATGAVDFSNTIVKLTALPTSAPTESGQLWNDAGTIKIV